MDAAGGACPAPSNAEDWNNAGQSDISYAVFRMNSEQVTIFPTIWISVLSNKGLVEGNTTGDDMPFNGALNEG
jgi:hypothetical protein